MHVNPCPLSLYLSIRLSHTHQGILSCSGKYVLFVDADGATKFSDLSDLENELKKIERDSYGVAVGSRAHLVNTDVVVKVD